MALLSSLLARRDILARIAVERLTEPLHLNVLAAFVAVLGGLRAKVAFDLVVRQQHAYGLLDAADRVRALGLRHATAVELGVGSGTGLMNLAEVAARVTRATGVKLRIVGFDTGRGLPPPRDYRDHPELYREGWFPMEPERLRAAVPAGVDLLLGPIEDTMPGFLSLLSPDAPLAFATLDVDLYHSAKQALRLFDGEASCYLPFVTVYVDDVMEPTHSIYAGELLAIEEFNREHPLRKLEPDRFLRYRRVYKHAEWLAHMYKLHVFDHPRRTDVSPPSQILAFENPYLRSR